MSTSPDKAIEILKLCKNYNGFRAVDDVSLEIKKGEIFGLLGPNGAGKSTTINILATRTKQTSGTVRVLGFDISKNSRSIKGILGLIPQEITLYDHLTAREMLKLMTDLYSIPKTQIKPQIEKMLRFAGLETREGYIKTFSGGMKRRLNLVASLIHDPTVIILDEPTAGVDTQIRRKIWEMILDLKKAEKTIILTTHLMDEADRLCDRVGIMDHGKIIALDTPLNLKKKFGEQQAVEVVAELPEVMIRELEKIEGVARVEVQKNSETQIIESLLLVSENGVDLLPSITEIGQRTGVSIISVEVRDFNLEDVFIALTGRSLREYREEDVR